MSFVVPAYNAANTLAETVRAIQSQTISNWEMLIVDDGSEDTTLSVARRIEESDARVRVISMPCNSGRVFEPRTRGVEAAAAELVIPIDADDSIEDKYLEKLLDVFARHSADVVFPTMFTAGRHIPDSHDAERFGFYEKSFNGRECIKFTLNGWRIGCNGGLYKKDTFLRAAQKMMRESDCASAFIDEVQTRYILREAKKVCFSEAIYYYVDNPDSITRKSKLRHFDFLNNDLEINHLIHSEFGGGVQMSICWPSFRTSMAFMTT